MKNFIFGLFAALILIAAGYFSYLYGKNSVFPTAALPTPVVTPALQPTPGISDNDLIKAALYKKNNWPDNSVTVTVSKNDGKYAGGTAGGQGGGGYFYAAKINGNWEIVADGNGTISCSSLVKYPDFPKTLIPSCYDDQTGKSVTR